jgi:hypothetical protein
MSEYVSDESALEGLHDPKEFRQFQKIVRCQLMYFHIKLLENGRQNRIARKSESTGKEVPKHNNFIGLKRGDLFTRRETSITDRKKSRLLVFLDKIGCNLRLAEHKSRGIRFTLHSDKFTWISVNAGEILLATRSVLRSYFPIFTTPGIESGSSSRIICMRLNVLRIANVFFGWRDTSSD